MKPKRLLLPMLAAVLIGAAAASTLAAASGTLVPAGKKSSHRALRKSHRDAGKPPRHVNAALVRRLQHTDLALAERDRRAPCALGSRPCTRRAR